MPVQYYSWEDSGAPQIQTTRSGSNNWQCNITEIFDAILITGYGSKPGMGWTKLMTSEIEGSDRTVYQNQSTADENMNLIVQSHIVRQNGFLLQIADVVNSPEEYEHYSDVISINPSTGSTVTWYAVGDERTMIFILSDTYSQNVKQSYWDSYYPGVIYAGDMDDPNGNYPKPWCLLGPGSYNGKIDDVEAAGSVTSSGVMGFSASHTAITKSRRPVTQVPGEEWAAQDCFWFMLSCESTYYFSNSSDYQIRTPDVFTNNASIKAPWFFVLQQNYIFQLRGVYNIYPWITSGYSSTAESRNWLVKLDAFGEQFFAFSKDHSRADDYYSHMEVYIQLTGEW